MKHVPLTSSVPLSESPKKTPKKGIDIQKVMDYPLPHVLARYQKDYHVSAELAKIHERELKRYLILGAEHIEKPIDMLSTEVDNLWHTFLLFTQDYAKFCHTMLGQFIHHVPKVEETKITVNEKKEIKL